jgi:hypothetical protein
VKKPEPTAESPQNLCLDAVFIGEKYENIIKERNYIPYIRSHGEEKK